MPMTRLLFAPIVSLSLALAPTLSHAQVQAQGGPPVGNAAVTPAGAACEAAAPAPAVPLPAAAQPAAPQTNMPTPWEIAYAQEVLRTQLLRQRMLLTNHDYRLPAVGFGLGVASLIIGSVVFSLAWRAYDESCDWEQGCDDAGYNQRGDRAGLVMMPVGALLILVNTPLLAVRLRRHNRLRETERYLEQLSRWTGQVALHAPTRQALGLTSCWHF